MTIQDFRVQLANLAGEVKSSDSRTLQQSKQILTALFYALGHRERGEGLWDVLEDVEFSCYGYGMAQRVKAARSKKPQEEAA